MRLGNRDWVYRGLAHMHRRRHRGAHIFDWLQDIPRSIKEQRCVRKSGNGKGIGSERSHLYERSIVVKNDNLMTDTQKQKIGPHWRIPWRSDEPENILVHCRFDQLKGTFRKSGSDQARGTEKYLKAKRENDHEAAADLVEEFFNEGLLNPIIDALIEQNKPCRVVFPHPEFDSDEPKTEHIKITNAIPFAVAAYLAAILGGEVETEIVETARPGRTKLNRFERFLWQPRFSGDIDPAVSYIIVDDNCTLGGTLAMLRTHIVGNGGTVIGATALSTPEGRSIRFGIADVTLDVVISQYGREISPLWIEEIGHDITCLTDSEGSFLANWDGRGEGKSPTLLQRLRDRLDKAKATGK